MIAIYKKVTAKEVASDTKEAIEKVTNWFADPANKRRKVCSVKLWYNKIVKIRKGHIEEGIKAAAEEALK